MTKKIRRKFMPQEKVAILKQHLLEGKAVSDVCDAHGLNPNVFYRWQKEFFENGAAAFEKTDKRTEQAAQRRHAELEAKLAKKVREGGSGVWGTVPMPPNNVTPAEAKELATWVLAQK